MEYEPTWRLKISDMCRDFYNLSKKYSDQNVSSASNEFLQTNEIKVEFDEIVSLDSEKQIIRQFKLNHGLFLDGYKIEPSKQAVFSENGELNMSLYNGQPLVYTSINDHSRTNLLNF